ncbi:MAG: tRNA (adenosine(37)-N6)-dimethylallyltransferase MiaA [Verrucomicrobia bacterium]|nr:tRNA (adenosine(37)-N6)-dimethylallyltransferase MiaA [Verrucomicrobiota bacterium]
MVPALWICGPTAVGKSLVALQLAEEIEGEIISVDSMQVYRGMDIGTAKPTAKERERVRHHLLDVVDLPGTFTVADFLESAAQAEREVRSRNKTPVYCGGTGLYFKAMSHGIGAGPAPDEKLRRELEEQTIEALLEEVRARDEALWRVLDRSNRRRVVRAVEMLRLSGKKVSESRSAWGACSVANVVAVGLRRTREELVQRIEHRVREMFKAGLVEEVERLAGSGLLQSATARQALGYRQVLEMKAAGKKATEMEADVALRTRQFAKRQMTWFRAMAGLEWIDWESGLTAREIASRMAAKWRLGSKHRHESLSQHL